MLVKRFILLLKMLFVIIIALVILQFIFVLNPNLSEKLQISLFALRIPIKTVDTAFIQSLNWYILSCSIPFYMLGLYIILKLIHLLNPLINGLNPFTEKSVIVIKRIGYACFIYALIKVIVEYTGAILLLHTNVHSIPEWNTELSLPVAPLIAGLLVLSLAEVFSQGLALKKDNDSFI
jgi:hypothetical protein